MTNRTMDSIRMILLILVVVLLGLTAYLYFETGKLNFGTVVVALGCLIIFFVTRRKDIAGKP
jgi:hypothetical protein